MEAQRFGFDATDANILAHYLLPRAVGLPNPDAHDAVIDEDTASCPPWELMRRHGLPDSAHAFFFRPPRDPAANTGRTKRAVPAGEDGASGTWRGQKSQGEKLLRVRGRAGGSEIELKYRRHNLMYYRDGEKKATRWVMLEYQITEPPPLAGAVLSRVRKAKK